MQGSGGHEPLDTVILLPRNSLGDGGPKQAPSSSLVTANLLLESSLPISGLPQDPGFSCRLEVCGWPRLDSGGLWQGPGPLPAFSEWKQQHNA